MKKIILFLTLCFVLISVNAQSLFSGRRGGHRHGVHDTPAVSMQDTPQQEPSVSIYTPAVQTVMEPNAYRPVIEAIVSVILPFNLASTSVAEDKLQMRSVEFYQGLLLAVNKAQLMGQRVRVQSYDLGTRAMNDILADENLLKSHVIIAPMDSAQVRQVADFGESHNIPVLSPIVYCESMVESYPHLYQMNPKLTSSSSELYNQLTSALLDQFRNYLVVFVRDSLFQTKLDPYPVHLKAAMEYLHLPYHEYVYNEPYSVVCMDSALNLGEHHVLYVLETPQKEAIRRFFPSLKNKLFLDANPAIAEFIGATYASGENKASNVVAIEEALPDSLCSDSARLITEARDVAILGYPEWQRYTNDFMDYYYDLNVWMFSKFYANPFEMEVQEFYEEFKYWYNRELMPISPKYGLLGYDVMTYCLTKLGTSGALTPDTAEEESVHTLQTSIRFDRCGQGCFLNKGLYLVHFTPETTIEKIEIR